MAQVGGSSITKAELDHWIPIEAILTHELRPRKSVPRGVVPDPPDYGACILYLKTVPQKAIERGAHSTAAQLRSQCQQRYQMLRQTVLNFLITTEWLIGEGTEQGLKATDAEIKHRFEQVKKAEFPRKGEFERQLVLTGETMSDQLFRAKVKVLSINLEREILTKRGLTHQQRTQAYVKFFTEAFPTKWIARTSCRAGYVVPNCKQYKGSQPPEIRI
ncbi:MAG TPA: hypothetical protein VGG98_08105 [Solirubrobacteraceae bacterium]